jgi:RNA-directed DNA polymerase
MTNWSAHSFRKKAAASGLSPAETEAAIAVAAVLERNGLFPLLTLNHLAVAAGVKYRLLRGVVTRRSVRAQYRTFRISKRRGGRRRIFVPGAELQRALRWLNSEIFGRVEPHSRCFSYRKNVLVRDCAAQHSESKWLIKFDIENFFESISEVRVYWLMRSLGFTSLLSFEIAKIVTVPIAFVIRRAVAERPLSPSMAYANDKYVIDGYYFPERGVLGQGLATSPAVSNLVCRSMDEELFLLSQERGLVFTRYADDITFSSADMRLSRSAIRELRTRVSSVLRAHGFRENRAKFSVAGPGSRRIVLGLLVDGESPRLSKAMRARIRGHLKYLSRGPAEHALRRGFRSLDSLRDHVRGLIASTKDVDPAFHDASLEMFGKIPWPPG